VFRITIRVGLVLVLAVLTLGAWTVAGASVLPATESGVTAPPGDGGAVTGDTGADAPTDNATVEIEAVLPNPVADGDQGEYVVLSAARPTNLSGWSVADADGTAHLPNRTVSGRVRLTTDPGAVSGDAPVVELRDGLTLANGGERVELRRGNRTVDVLSYDDAPEGELLVRDGGEWVWRPLGATHRPIVRARGADVRSFVLPDSPDAPLNPLLNATERILLAGYTIASDRVVDTMCSARDRGVRVEALFEGGPVGGITERAAARLDRLSACGVPVAVVGGDVARYRFHHAKYAVVDEAAIVLTENWKPSGTGGRSNRGWGTVVNDPRIADTLAETFRADTGFRDAIPWDRYRTNATFAGDSSPPVERYPERFEPRVANATGVSVLVAPDNAESAIVRAIDAAETSIRVEQISIGSRNHPFVQALLRAARRGVSVRVLLGSARYVRPDNREIAAYLNERADEEDLPLEASLATPRSRYGKIHAKGIVIDDTTVLGSINWTNVSVRANREIALLIEDATIARYYARVFRADWRGGVWSVSAGVLLLTAFAIAGATIVGARMTFAPGYSVSPGVAEP